MTYDTDPLNILLDQIEEVQRVFADTYQREGVNVWLKSRNRHLDNRTPLQLIFAGEMDRVMAEAHRIAGS